MNNFFNISKDKAINDADGAYKQAMDLLDSDTKSFPKTNALRLGRENCLFLQ